MKEITKKQPENITCATEIIHGLPSIRKGGRNFSADMAHIAAIIVVGSSGSGKSTLHRSILQASRLDPDLVDHISIPQRIVTRARRADDSEEITHVSPDEFEGRIQEGKLGLFGIKIMEGGREEKYGYAQPEANTLPIFFANNGVVKNPELVQPTGILDNALIIAVFAPDEERKRRVLRRSPELLQQPREFAFRFSQEESSLNLIGKTDFIIDCYGPQGQHASSDFTEFLKRIIKQSRPKTTTL